MPKLSPTEPCLHDGVSLHDASFGAYNEVGAGSVLRHTTFEDYAYCERLCDIANTTVRKFANIAAMCRIGPTDHPYANAAQHHFLYRSSWYWDDVEDDAAFFEHRASRRTEIGVDCWLGHGVIVKPEVTIGTGAIIASGAVVTRDVPPFMIMAGVPAVPLRARFAPGVGERLMALAWWDWDHARLRQALSDFRALSAEAFLEKYHG